MLEQILQWDKELLLFLNSFHTPFLDEVMYEITKTIFWVPLYILLLFLILKDYRNDSWIPLLGILITILFADQVTAGIMKPFFQRLRPSQEPALEGLVQLVKGYKGGKYGFASSHAANTFGTATFFWFLMKEKRKWIGVLFLWASTMTYSRIYLGVHYPGDIIVGAIVGIGGAALGLTLMRQLTKRFAKVTSPERTPAQ